MSRIDRVAFLCLGVMGFPMAGHLARAGLSVTVYNRTPERAERWAEVHGDGRIAVAATPAEAVREAEVVLACSGADPDLESITLGPGGAFDAMREGAIFVDHTTASATLARRLSEAAAARGLRAAGVPHDLLGLRLGALEHLPLPHHQHQGHGAPSGAPAAGPRGLRLRPRF